MMREIASELAARRKQREASRQAKGEHGRIRYIHDTVNLRAEPNRGSLLIRRRYPDHLLMVSEAKDDWVKVEIFDYAGERAVSGWVCRRNQA